MINILMYGLYSKVKQVFDGIRTGDSNIMVLSSSVYVFDVTDEELGTFVYTKFVDGVPLYTVRIPFSFNQSLLEMITKGDGGLYGHRSPQINEIPS